MRSKAPKPLVSIIIPSWNGLVYLKVCLKSIAKQTFNSYEIIVVDNGSTDGTIDYLNNFDKQIQVISLPKNIGFAPAVNLGIKASRGSYLLLLNNDTEVTPNCLTYLVRALESDLKLGFIAAKTLNYYKRSVIDSAGDYIDVVGHANNLGMGQKDGPIFNKPHNLFLASGGGSLFKKEIFDKVGLLDEDYFAYYEDVDLCLRAQFVGFSGWYEPKAVIYHIHKATSDRIKPFREYLQFRNMTMTIIKDFPKTLLLSNFNWLKIILVNFHTVYFLAGQGYIKEALKAELYILTNIPGLLKKRRKIQASITVSNKYIIDNFQSKKLKLFGRLI